jgi:hypothetical protein
MTDLPAEDIPDEWVKAAQGGYSMHGAGLIRNVLAATAPLIAAAERERCAQLAERHDVRYSKPVYTPVATVPPTVNLSTEHAPFADLLRQDQP